MKALSLTQPWAHAVIHHGKTIENRRWNTKFRGEFLIHAAKKMTQDDYDVCSEVVDDVCGLTILPEFGELQRGGIVGRATLVDVVHPQNDIPPAFRRYPDGDGLTGSMWRWHFDAQYGFVLADVRPLPFVPCLGALGFWRVPPAVLRQLDAGGP